MTPNTIPCWWNTNFIQIFELPLQNVVEFQLLKWKMVFEIIIGPKTQKMKCVLWQDTPTCQILDHSEKVCHGVGHLLGNLGTYTWDSHLKPSVREQPQLSFNKLKVYYFLCKLGYNVRHMAKVLLFFDFFKFLVPCQSLVKIESNKYNA